MKLKVKLPSFPWRAGFTLVELLGVILIISVLSSLLFVGIAGVRAHGNRVRCVNNLRQLVLAVTQFARDNDVYPERERWLATDVRRGASTGQLYKYIGDAKLYACPSDTTVMAELNSGQATRLTSYAYNAWFSSKNANTSVDMSAAVVFIEPETLDHSASTVSFEGIGPVLTDRHSGGGLVAFGDAHSEYYGRAKYQANKRKIFEVTQ